MDGLLIDSESVVREGVVRAAELMGHDFPPQLFIETIGRSEADYLRIIREHFGPDFPMADFQACERREIGRLFEAGVALKAGVIELIDELEAMKLPIAVATSSSRTWAEKHLTPSGIYGRFATIVGREDVERHKPYPDPYLEAARRLGVEPLDCLALEDSHNGVRAAHAAGMMTVMVPDLLDPTEEMRGLCVHILESLHHVRELVAVRG
jgi:HAD superfamily hydrolase (TIGR01509 family)